MAWELYDEMIAGIPEGIQVVDYGLGLNWSWLKAECGSGISYTTRGGSTAPGRRDLRGKELRRAAELAKSWCFEDATIGVAALNAWYSQHERLEALPAASLSFGVGRAGREQVDPFDVLKPEIEARGGDAKVVVIGHFPHVEDIAEHAELTVLERNCRNDCDVPDPACEYVIPDADYVYMTGVTIMNKTAPRLLELSRDAKTIVVGPSAIPAPALVERADAVAGRVVLDEEKLRFCCATREAFGDALESFLLTRA